MNVGAEKHARLLGGPWTSATLGRAQADILVYLTGSATDVDLTPSGAR
jgi:hypothetical protein